MNHLERLTLKKYYISSQNDPNITHTKNYIQSYSCTLIKVPFAFVLSSVWVGNSDIQTKLDALPINLFPLQVLCLASGERISTGPGMKLIFEVDNLANASPATVSRCAMVYVVS